MNVPAPVPAARRLGELQLAQQQDEVRRGLRALLLRPLMPPQHPDFRPCATVRAPADWFARETAGRCTSTRGARLYKRRPTCATRPAAAGYDRRRYVLLPGLRVLERADPQSRCGC